MKIKMCDEFYYRISCSEDNIFKELNTCKENVLRNNNDIDFYCGEWVKVKVNDFGTHIVKPTETIKEIATKHNLTIEKLMQENKLKEEKLFIGQILKIPNKQ